LYILKGIVDAARYVQTAYTSKDTRLDSIRTFRSKVSERIAEVANFCNLDKLHYEKMLCSVLLFARSMEGVLYKFMKRRMSKKQKTYDKLPLQSTEQIYACVEVNLPDSYVYNQNTSVVIFDVPQKTTRVMYLDENQLEHINDTHPICIGTLLYDIYNSIINENNIIHKLY
jgi:hypothetical protein